MRIEAYTGTIDTLVNMLVEHAIKLEMEIRVGRYAITVRMTAPEITRNHYWLKDRQPHMPKLRIGIRDTITKCFASLDSARPEVRAKYVEVEQAFLAWERGEREMPTADEFGGEA